MTLRRASESPSKLMERERVSTVSPGAIRAFADISIPLPAVEAFPTSLSAVHLAGLDSYLPDNTTAMLREFQQKLRDTVAIAPILRARTQRTFEESFRRAYGGAVGYYIESGILVWRALECDYSRLLHLSQVSHAAIDSLFFDNARKLERDTFVNAVTALRVLARVGEWVIRSQKASKSFRPPLEYLDRVVLATFVTWCILAYLRGEVRNTRRDNLRTLADFILTVGELAFQEAVEMGLHTRARESNHWFWSPEWQVGEVEADLDKRLGDLETSSSVEELVRDLSA